MSQISENWLDNLMPINGNREMIPLKPEQFETCQRMSTSNRFHSRQWQHYLQALALSSFTTWLQEREPSLVVQQDTCSIFQPAVINVIDAVCGLEVGEFKVCLIPTISVTDYEVAIPRALVDLPEYAAHFYVVIALDEDAEIATIQGFLRYDQLIHSCSAIEPDMDWNYSLFINQLNGDANELLLNLQCLDPIAIPLPSPIIDRSAMLSRLQASLAIALSQVKDQPLWKTLIWDQAAVVLTTPKLLNWLYQDQSHNAPSPAKSLTGLLQSLTQQATNLWLWLQNQVDAGSGWELIPLSQARDLSGFLPRTKLHGIIQEIKKTSGQAVAVPDQIGSQDLLLDDHRLRAYVCPWSLTEHTWRWLIVVGAIPGDPPPYGLRLQVSNEAGILVEEELKQDRQQAYLYVQIKADYNEMFFVTLTSAKGTTHSFSPLTFKQEG